MPALWETYLTDFPDIDGERPIVTAIYSVAIVSASTSYFFLNLQTNSLS